MKGKLIILPDGKRGHIYDEKQLVEDRVTIYLVDEENRWLLRDDGKPRILFKQWTELAQAKLIGFTD